MKIGVYYIASTTAAAAIARETDLPWIKKLSEMSGLQIEFTDKEHIDDYDLILDFILPLFVMAKSSSITPYLINVPPTSMVNSFIACLLHLLANVFSIISKLPNSQKTYN